MPNDILPDWEQVLAAAAQLQRILPGAVLVGGSAASVYAQDRLSTDADHVLTDLRQRFDQVLAFDRIYPQPNEESALQQLQIQLANPLPYDLEELNLVEYKNLDERWRNWQNVRTVSRDCATLIFDRIVGLVD